MNVKRALYFAILLYLATFVVYGVLTLIPNITLISQHSVTLTGYVYNWILTIPIVLILAKWYFRKATVSWKQGVYLGLIASIVAILLDVVSVFLTWQLDQPLDVFVAMYTDWKFYVSLLEVTVLTTLAGSEFDATFTNRSTKNLNEKVNKKKKR